MEDKDLFRMEIVVLFGLMAITVAVLWEFHSTCQAPVPALIGISLEKGFKFIRERG